MIIMVYGKKRKKQIFLDRFRFFLYEVALGFILIFLLLLIPVFLIPLIVSTESELYGILIYSSRAIMVFIGVPLILHFSNLLFQDKKKNVIGEEDISPAMGHLRLFKVTKKNYQYQILYGLLIFFLVFLPLDFFTYLLVPKMLEYQSITLASRPTDIYLGGSYVIFLISVIVIQLSVGITEETVSRGLLTKRGSEHYFRMSAVLISAIYFGLGHFAYFLDPISRFYPIWYPFIWFLQAFFIGIILSLLVLRRKWLIPAIIAHTLNNIISAHAVWNFLIPLQSYVGDPVNLIIHSSEGNSFSGIIFYLYTPLLIIGVILLIWQFPRIKGGLSIGIKMFREYFKFDVRGEKTIGDRIFRVFIDIVVAMLIFLMGIMITI